MYCTYMYSACAVGIVCTEYCTLYVQWITRQGHMTGKETPPCNYQDEHRYLGSPPAQTKNAQTETNKQINFPETNKNKGQTAPNAQNNRKAAQ